MPTYVACDGEVRGGGDTFVPRYIDGVQYYAAAGQRLIQAGGAGQADGVQIGAPDGRYAALSAIPNLQLAPDTRRDEALNRYLEVSGEALFPVDDDIPLCAWDGAQPCIDGAHFCSGLFGVMAWEDPRLQQGLVILSAPQMRLPGVAVEEEVDWAAVDERNRAALKELVNGAETSFLQSGERVLIGEGHAGAALRHLAGLGYEEGTILITKGSLLSTGRVYVTGASDQEAFVRAVGRISAKTVSFGEPDEDDDQEE